MMDWLQRDSRYANTGNHGGAGYIVVGSIGYTVRNHALMGSYSKTAGDTYGFGSFRSEVVSTSWQWKRPGTSWGLFASGGIHAFWQTQIEYVEQTPYCYGLAKDYLRLGEKEKAIVSLKKSYEGRDFDFIFRMVSIMADNFCHIFWRWQIINHRIQHWLHAFVFERRAI